MTTEIVRGEGHAPGESAGEPMPTVTTTERKSLRDFQEDMRRRNTGESPSAGARDAQPNGRAQGQTSGSRVAEFSKKLEASQEQPTMPGESRQRPQEGNPEEQAAEVTDADGEPGKAEQEKQQAGALDDKTALAKFREWEQSDMFPKELESRLHEITVNGQVEYKDTAELRRGYQRGSDSRRVWSEAKQLQEEAQAEKKSVQEHFELIKDHETFLEMYERNGFDWQWMEGLAKRIAQQVDDRIRLVQAAGLVEMNRRGTQDWNDRNVQEAMQRAEQNWARARQADVMERRLQYERSQFEGQRKQVESQTASQQLATQYSNQLNQLRPAAFRAYGIPDNKANQEALLFHLGRVVKQKGFSGSITRDLVMDAASDLSEEMGDERTARRGGNTGGSMTPSQWKAAQNSNGRPLPPNRIAGGGGNQASGANQPRKSVTDFEREIRARRSGGQ